MIDFRIDPRSGVSPYRQIVNQVRQALRLGLLREGDQLPTVKEVVAAVAINPNTVLKAYRELEHDGLAEGRPGVGTFITRSLAGSSLAARSSPPQGARPLAEQGPRCGARRRQHRGAVRGHVPRNRRRGGRGVTTAIDAADLGKCYRGRWALRHTTVRVPAGKVVGLVGANGAGKSTLLHLAAGLLRPSEGEIRVLGGCPGDTREQLAKVGLLAQDAPLYGRFTVADHLELGARLNPSWDAAAAATRIARVGLDHQQKAAELSGGQRSQLALTLAVGKRPDLLLLDEPVASLDPLARREFLQDLMALAADGLSIVLSSHLIGDLERVCDHLVVLAHGHVRLAGDIDDILGEHSLITAPRLRPDEPIHHEVVGRSDSHAPDHASRSRRSPNPQADLDHGAGRPRGDRARLHGAAGLRGAGPQEHPECRVTWLAWRQLRAQAAVLAAALLVVVVALVATRSHLVDVYSRSGDHELTGLYVWLRLLGTVLIGLPAIIGAFWGAPMIASELEQHTHRLAWTQSITRDRWLAMKLALTAAASVAVVGIFAAVFTWWCAPLDATDASRISPANFAQRGFISIGYTLFALAAGVLIGAIARRTLPAMAATLMAFLIARLAIQKLIRPHLVPATSVRTDPFGPGPRGGWTLSTHTVDAAGHRVGHDLESHLATVCHITRATPDVDAALARCAHQRGFQNLTRAIPPGSFWQLQAIELIIFVGLAAIAAGATFWWLRHRTS